MLRKPSLPPLKKTKQKKLLQSCDDNLSGFCRCVHEPNEQITEWLNYFCSLTELFTTNKHATYCTNILYPVAVYEETILFDTMKGNYTQKLHICFCFVFKKPFMKSNLAPS